ncbi:MAG: SUMF1/EgtB/PvdO family nonheme iron enzyme [Thermoguttaceae bacterium]|jgi:serine/threonine-protein kinase
MNDHRTTCDPQRIELFLEQKLSDEEQSVFESHLSSCGDCRQRLETAAASEDVWTELCESLRDEQLPPDGLRCGDADSTDEDASSGQTTVLKLLAPTDDDRMLGRWGTYEVVGVVGTGGMGVVLKAFDAALNRYVAIKVLAPHLGSSGAARKRFSREAQAAAAVVHDNVIEIYHVAETAGLPYLVMPYVRGPSLQRRLDDGGPMALAEILRVGMQAAAGLAAAHAQGLVHRDVKPANILLADGIERVKLTDFGLARAADDASLTKTGVIAGTPQYMSPEQARGEAVDQRSDLFSLGSVLYAMCTGRAPFRAETSYGVLRRITDEEPRPIREINAEIPEWLCGIVAKLMAKQPDDRFQSAEEVAKLLEECLAHIQQPTAVPVPAALAKPARKVAGTLRVPSAVRRAWWPPVFRFKGVVAMIAALGAGLLGALLVSATPPDISGTWQGEGWGQVVLTQTAPGEYTGTYTDTVAKETEPGKIDLKWSRIERRFNGTWREGDDDRFGDLSLRLVDHEIRGALTASAKSKVNPATPRLADFAWTRTETKPSEAGRGNTIWDVSNDFSIAKGNPNGTWTYGMVYKSAFVPYTKKTDDGQNRLWLGDLAGDRSPELGIKYGPPINGVQSGQFFLHPGPGGVTSTARWTAPAGISPRVHVQGQFLPGSLGGKEVGICVNGIPGVNAPYWHSAIRPEYYHEEDEGDDGTRAVHPKSAPRGVHPRRPARFDFLLDVSPGDTLDFAVYGGYIFGSTPLEATVTSVPEGSTARPPLAVAPCDEATAREHQARWAKYLHAPVVQSNSIGMKLVLIPPGEFAMGSSKELIEGEMRLHGGDSREEKWYRNNLPGEGPQHRVRITKPFWLGATPVTQGEYERVTGSNPSKFPMPPPISKPSVPEYERVTGSNPSKFQRDPQRPVEQVSWDDAVEFCRKLSALPGEKAAKRRYGLPTEAQWEYACRAGTTTRWYAGDNEAGLFDVAWFNTNSGGQTHPVGGKKPNAWGLYDMHGSVWEWCRDWYDKEYYAWSPIDDPAGPPGGSFHVVRGGIWSDPARYCRSGFRNADGPGGRYAMGFRVSLVPVDK